LFEVEPSVSDVDLPALRSEVVSRPVPQHVAIIMDGNGRWAEDQEKPRLFGHREGSNSVREVTRAARRLGVRYLTLYAFSTQNWLRPADEVSGLMELLAEYLILERQEILENGIRLSTIGETDRLPQQVREPLLELMEASRHNDAMTLTLALSYGGREELVRAAQLIAQEVAAGTLNPADVDLTAVRSRLWTAALPDPDLIIRTSGEVRLSNFLLFQAAYAEIVVTDAAWPAFRERELLLALKEFQGRERRFGQTSAQIRAATGTAAVGLEVA
jgi:undecaprenyl diphosphate synthase